MKEKCVWYVSKYVVIPKDGSLGARGFLLMSELARLGNKCVVITSDSIAFSKVPEIKENYLREEIDNVEVFWLKTYKYNIAKSIKRVLSWIHFELKLLFFSKKKITPPDTVIISSLSILTILNGFLLKKKYKCRLIFEIRDIWPLTLTEEGGFKNSNLLIKLLSFIEKLGYRYADHIVGTMPNLKEHVVKLTGSKKPVSCIPMGIDPSSFKNFSSVDQIYLEKYLSSSSFKIMYAGSIGITNALETFLECAQSLKENKNIKFIIIGEGDLKIEFQKKYGDLNNLIFAPKVKKEHVQSVLSHADILYLSVHDSKVWHYGQSLNKLIDYMYAAKPIIASFYGFHSMINEANCGSFIEPNDSQKLKEIIIYYSNLPKEDLHLIGLKGKNWILKKRTYSILAKKYEQIIFPRY